MCLMSTFLSHFSKTWSREDSSRNLQAERLFWMSNTCVHYPCSWCGFHFSVFCRDSHVALNLQIQRGGSWTMRKRPSRLLNVDLIGVAGLLLEMRHFVLQLFKLFSFWLKTVKHRMISTLCYLLSCQWRGDGHESGSQDAAGRCEKGAPSAQHASGVSQRQVPTSWPRDDKDTIQPV